MFIIVLNSCGSLSMERLSAVLMDRKQVQRLMKVEMVCKVWKDEEIATIR